MDQWSDTFTAWVDLPGCTPRCASLSDGQGRRCTAMRCEMPVVSTSSGDGLFSWCRLKVVIATVDADLVKRLMHFMKNDRRCNVRRGELVTPHRMGDHDFGDVWTELDMEVCADIWRKELFLFVRWFSSFCAQLNCTVRPVLQLSDKAFFINDCIPAHLGLNLIAFHCGNLVNSGMFVSHFTRLAHAGTVSEQKLCMAVFKKLRGEDAREPMFVDFEHDRDVLVIRFPVLDGGFRRRPDEQNKKNGGRRGSTDGRSHCTEYYETVERRSSSSSHRRRSKRGMVVSRSRDEDADEVVPGSAVAIRVRYTSIRRIVIDIDTRNFFCESGCKSIYFHLNYPPEIRKYQKKPKENGDYVWSEGNRWRTIPEYNGDTRDNCAAINESPVIGLQFSTDLQEDILYELLSRLRVRVALPLEFCSVGFDHFDVKRYAAMPVSFVGCDHRPCAGSEVGSDKGPERILDEYKPPFPPVDPKCEKKIKECGVFGLEYLIAALFSRGAVVKDQILIDERRRDNFINLLLMRFNENKELTLESLERLLNLIDEAKQIPPLTTSFERIRNALVDQKNVLEEIYKETQREGYQRVRKVVITPTRTLFVVPELLMGNRVLRNFDKDGNGALRVQFRDDDGTQLRLNTVGPHLIQTTTFNTLTRGIHIGDRHFVYLGSSNSQMRDNGCYFFDDGEGGQAQIIRQKLGKFDRGNIPKMMSRIGQCFTQAKQCAVRLERSRYNKTWDVIGAVDSRNEPFTFSDGVGRVSEEFAAKIAEDIGYGSAPPSCFQIRHRGIKGVLSIDPSLDRRKKWAKSNDVRDESRKTQRLYNINVEFRPSQDKFKAPRDDYIEVVKYSSPTPVSLNRPMISILDQVSELQGTVIHKRVTERIHDLLDLQLTQLAEMLMSEDRCREMLNELPQRINVDRLSLVRGFALTQEPFFRSLLQARAKYTIRKQLVKEQIQIPPNLGRSVFGVMDETGTLQYGQIFVQITNNIRIKSPLKRSARTVITGRVLMTKNPCIVAGDVRIMEAVDVPALHHLIDVVVFPQHGSRPHPDEMAGSDLDGDEYTVIWDKELMFDHNEDPLDFAKKARECAEVDDSKVVLEMRKFFMNYIKQDSIGSIANAFLVNADLFGIASKVCNDIARKHSQAVDFPKTGEAPAPLTRWWTFDAKDNSWSPPERAERWPDFMCKNHEPSYISPRMVGQLYRRIRVVDDVLALTGLLDEAVPVEIDPNLVFPGWTSYEKQALREYDSYNTHIRSLLDNYGIEDEGQLFSGCISAIRNRISDRDMDDMSFYNTNHIIEKRVTNTFRMFRKAFFDEFGGFLENTRPDDNSIYSGDDRRFCSNPTIEMKKKASAYYVVCYREAADCGSRRLLSFGWLAWDILCRVKQDVRLQNDGQIIQSLDPLSEYLDKHITRYCVEHHDEMKLTLASLTSAEKDGIGMIEQFIRRYSGLGEILFFLCQWGEQCELFEDHLKREHLCLLFIQFGLGKIGSDSSLSISHFLSQKEDGENAVYDLHFLVGGLGRCFLRFLQYLSTRKFETARGFNFGGSGIGRKSALLRCQWKHLHRAALATFYRVTLTSRFDELPLEGGNGGDLGGMRVELVDVTEMTPFMIELPNEKEMGVTDDELRTKVQKHTGVKFVHFRRVRFREDRVIVSAVGTLKSLHTLRELLAVEPKFNSFDSGDSKQRSDMIGRAVFMKVKDLT